MKIEGPSESLDVGWQREASAGLPTSASLARPHNR